METNSFPVSETNERGSPSGSKAKAPKSNWYVASSLIVASEIGDNIGVSFIGVTEICKSNGTSLSPSLISIDTIKLPLKSGRGMMVFPSKV